jgi:hypothetical protein
VYPELTGIKAMTFFGDAGEDFGTGVAISSTTGEVYVGGYSSSSTLPASGFGVQVANGGGNDAFILRMDAGLATTGAWQATFRGGGGNDLGYAIALSDQQAYVAGETASGNFPAVAGSAQSTPGGGGSDGFVAMATTDLRDPTSNPAAFSFAPVAGALPLSFQTSAPARVVPTASAVAYVDGQPGSTWCASSAANCSCDLTANGFTAAALTIASATPYYVCVRQVAPAAPNAVSEATLHVGAVVATFRVTTGQVPGFGCSLDVDGNGAMDALTDGLLVIRALFGLTGTSVTNGAVGANATRPTWSDISQYLNASCGGSFAP